MNGHARRLAILETAFGPPATPRPNRPLNMDALSDAEVDFMADLAERLRQTGGYHAFTDADLEDAARLLIAAGAESTRTQTLAQGHA